MKPDLAEDSGGTDLRGCPAGFSSVPEICADETDGQMYVSGRRTENAGSAMRGNTGKERKRSGTSAFPPQRRAGDSRPVPGRISLGRRHSCTWKTESGGREKYIM